MLEQSPIEASQAIAAESALAVEHAPSSSSMMKEIFARKDALHALWSCYADDIGFDAQVVKEFKEYMEETDGLELDIRKFIEDCFDRFDRDSGCIGTHFAGVLLDMWIRSGRERGKDGECAGLVDSQRLALVQKVFEGLREDDVFDDLKCDYPKLDMYLNEMEDIWRGYMINVFLVRNGATKIWQQTRKELRDSVCIRAPGTQLGESPEGNAHMKEIIATAMMENFCNANRQFDVLMTMSRGVDSVADFFENLSVDLCNSVAPHILLFSPADLASVKRILNARRKFQGSLQKQKIIINVAANDLMDFPGATHPNISIQSLVSLLAYLGHESVVSSSRIYRVLAQADTKLGGAAGTVEFRGSFVRKRRDGHRLAEP